MKFEPQTAIGKGRLNRFTPLAIQHEREETPVEAYKRGREEAAAESEQAFLASINALVAAAQDIRDFPKEVERRAFSRAAEFVARVIVEAAPAIAMESARQAILALLEKHIYDAESGAIVVRANADLLAAIRGRLGEIAARSALHFEEDPALGPACIAAQWRHGSVRCDIGEAAGKIVEAIEIEQLVGKEISE